MSDCLGRSVGCLSQRAAQLGSEKKSFNSSAMKPILDPETRRDHSCAVGFDGCGAGAKGTG